MKRVLTSISILLALLVAAPAQAQTSAPPGFLNQSKNTLIAKFTKLGFAFGKASPVGNGFSYTGVNEAAGSRVLIVTVKTGIAFVSVDYPGVVGAAAEAPENHLIDLQKAIKILLPNWKDGGAWVQAAHGVVVADANAGVDSAQKDAVENIESPLLYVTLENALVKDLNTVSFSLMVMNVAQAATLELPTTQAAAAPEPTAVPVAPAAFVAQPAPAEQPAPAPAQAAPAQPAAGCEPAYPTICIPLGSADLDCPDISARRFEVLPPDPHRFDGDHDGIGCESG